MIRDFIPGDQAAVRDLVLAGMRERWSDAYDPWANPDLEDISTNYVDNGAEVVVVEIGGAVVATGILLPDPGDRGRILRMSVHRHFRRQGFGRQIVEELIRRAGGRAMVEVVVRADTPWASALALYRSCGFTEVHQDHSDTHFALSL